jgi:hypothetical protein
MAYPNRALTDIDEEQEARTALIAELESMQSQTALGERLLSLRLQMLRAGQTLRSLDEINQELGREDYADVH